MVKRIGGAESKILQQNREHICCRGIKSGLANK